MDPLPETHITRTLAQLSKGDVNAAAKLLPLVYDELRRIADHYLHSERVGHTLQPTALVHEAYLKLVDQTRVDWQGRTHFLAVAADAMRRVLIDYARAHGRLKRGGDRQRVTLDEAIAPLQAADVDIADLHEAIEQLSELDERQGRIVVLRFFGGMTVEEVASVLGVSKRTAEADWTMARAWLRRKLSREDDS